MILIPIRENSKQNIAYLENKEEIQISAQDP